MTTKKPLTGKQVHKAVLAELKDLAQTAGREARSPHATPEMKVRLAQVQSTLMFAHDRIKEWEV